MPRAGGPAGGISQRSGILTAGSREQGGNGTAAGEAAEIPREKEGTMRGKSGLICAILGRGWMAGGGVQAAEPIKVGAILSVTGPASFLGAPEAKTLEMLVEEQNKKGGVLGRKIELIVSDSRASPEKAFSFAKT